MNTTKFEETQRSREYFHGLTLLPGAHCVIRVDGRSFSAFTAKRYGKPFDRAFSTAMTVTAQALLTEFDASYVYTESDEISILLPPSFDLFGRSVEKLVSISAGIASSTFTHEVNEPAHFDSRIWMGTSIDDVVDYFSWRQDDAARCALNGWCYWTLRNAGETARQATKIMDRLTTAEKNEVLFQRNVNFNDVPTWQRRGVGLWWEDYEHKGFNPIKKVDVTAIRRRVYVERELPMKDEYRELVNRLATC